MSLHRHRLGSVCEPFPGSEMAFDFIDRNPATAVRGLAHLMLALAAPSAVEARQEMLAARDLGIAPESWAAWAVLKGAQPAIQALTEVGVSWNDMTYQETPIIEWSVKDDRPAAVRTLLGLGFSPDTRLDHLPGSPFWLEHACAERKFKAARVLLEALLKTPFTPARQDILDRALLAVSRSAGHHGHSARLEDPEKWSLWRHLVKAGASPLRLHAPDSFSSSEQDMESWWPALNTEARAAWAAAGKPACAQAPVHHVVQALAATASVHNPDAANTWKALNDTVDWSRVPADGWGRGLRAVLLGRRYFDGHAVSSQLLSCGYTDAPGCSVVDAFLLIAGRECAQGKNDALGLSSFAFERWRSWVERERAEGRPAFPAFEAIDEVARMLFPSSHALLSAATKEARAAGVPKEAPLAKTLGAWERVLSEHVLPALPEEEAVAWKKTWDDVFSTIHDLKQAVAAARVDRTEPSEETWRALTQACALAVSLPRTPPPSARSRPRL